ncbi:MAG: phage Gp37/Gp68 family protein [Acidobacteriota bacterium]
MAQATSIEWTNHSWNFLRGCRRVSEGCGSDRGGGCYAERQAYRFAGPGGPYEGLVRMTPNGPRWTGELSFHEDILLAPLKRKKPTKYFVNSMSDLFYEKVTDEMLDKAFAVMALCPQHTFQILTKRPERMLEYFNEKWQPAPAQTFGRFSTPAETVGEDRRCQVSRTVSDLAEELALVDFESDDSWTPEGSLKLLQFQWPLPNVWLGVSCEDQKTADERIPILLQTPAAIRWISAEPLLGPIDLTNLAIIRHEDGFGDVSLNSLNGHVMGPDDMTDMKLNWAVVGGESGPNSRPCDIAWVHSILYQCKQANVPVFVKQLGAKPEGYGQFMHEENEGYGIEIGGLSSNRLMSRKGSDMDEWPQDLRVREFPIYK